MNPDITASSASAPYHLTALVLIMRTAASVHMSHTDIRSERPSSELRYTSSEYLCSLPWRTSTTLGVGLARTGAAGVAGWCKSLATIMSADWRSIGRLIGLSHATIQCRCSAGVGWHLVTRPGTIHSLQSSPIGSIKPRGGSRVLTHAECASAVPCRCVPVAHIITA